MDFLDLHRFVRITAHDKALGAIIGAALGDTIGLYTEFIPRTECSRAYPTGRFSLLEADLTPFREDSHRDKFETADWTDDTDQSLALILSFLHNYVPGSDTPPVKPSDIAQRLQIWVQQGLRCLGRPPLGIGMTTGRVLMDPEYLRDPEAVALACWLRSGRSIAPNGSLMRTHPLGVMCAGKTLEETFQVATDVGKVTHVDPRCVVSCCLVTALIRGIIRGEVMTEADLDALIEASFTWVDGNAELKNPTGKLLNEEGPVMMEGLEGVESTLKGEEYRKYCYAKTLRELELDDRTMGYVFKCLGSAVLTLRFAIREGLGLDTKSTGLFETLISNLVMEGGDADTNACVAGSLVGSWVGYSRLPSHWSKGMRNAEWLVAKAETLSFKAGIMEPRPEVRVKMLVTDPDTELDGSKGLLNKEQLEKMEKDFVLKMLLMQKARREAKEAADTAARKRTGVGKWFR
ncbi:hypothetical protein VE01_04873 [Pseudogymnoascus verrucosus]|uniref:ADP-ribosylglycohydrolase n=1 Tax=Pseudogymnoascus verrucosus TaxID=342668 RepID=A0A1B8GML1_9PEZI|nr:uncharacterized protein VE01_04873 [Pseudogymnoascus verrucosus]OBT97070.1 hypothetical protein VE01_04873 [Pseudogymnoascus verrucosus]